MLSEPKQSSQATQDSQAKLNNSTDEFQSETSLSSIQSEAAESSSAAADSDEYEASCTAQPYGGSVADSGEQDREVDQFTDSWTDAKGSRIARESTG